METSLEDRIIETIRKSRLNDELSQEDICYDLGQTPNDFYHDIRRLIRVIEKGETNSGNVLDTVDYWLERVVDVAYITEIGQDGLNELLDLIGRGFSESPRGNFDQLKEKANRKYVEVHEDQRKVEKKKEELNQKMQIGSVGEAAEAENPEKYFSRITSSIFECIKDFVGFRHGVLYERAFYGSKLFIRTQSFEPTAPSGLTHFSIEFPAFSNYRLALERRRIVQTIPNQDYCDRLFPENRQELVYFLSNWLTNNITQNVGNIYNWAVPILAGSDQEVDLIATFNGLEKERHPSGIKIEITDRLRDLAGRYYAYRRKRTNIFEEQAYDRFIAHDEPRKQKLLSQKQAILQKLGKDAAKFKDDESFLREFGKYDLTRPELDQLLSQIQNPLTKEEMDELYNLFRAEIPMPVTRRDLKNMEDFMRLVGVARYNADTIRQLKEMTYRIQRQQDQLVTSQRLSTLGDLAVSLSHEMGSHITSLEIVEEVIPLIRRLQEYSPLLAQLDNDQRAKLLKWTDYASSVGFEQGYCNEDLIRQQKEILRSQRGEIPETLCEKLVEMRIYPGDKITEFLEDLKGIESLADIIYLHYKIGAMFHQHRESKTMLRRLVNSVKAYSGIGAPKISDLDANNCIRTTLDILGYELTRRKIPVKLYLDENQQLFRGNTGEVNTVLTNIINNAADALQSSANPSLEVYTRPIDGRIQIEISNNGPEIPKNLEEKIYERGFTTKDKGWGIGLSICREVVQAHNGRLYHISNPERTSFYIELPKSI